MTIQIEETEEFAEKLAHVLGAVDKLKRAGTVTSPELFEHMLDEFLAQYTISTPMPAQPKTAGYIVVATHTGDIPFDFRGHLYTNEALALLGIENFLANRDYGKVSDYRIVKATYFG